MLAASLATPAQEDPYLWLEDVTGEKALAWVKEQNAATQPAIESSPGFKSALSLERFRKQLEDLHCALISPTDNIAPLDKRL